MPHCVTLAMLAQCGI